MANSQSVLSAAQGTYIVNTTSGASQPCDAIVALEDTIFDHIEIDGIDVKDDYIQDSATAIKAGSIIRPMNAQKFTSVRLTSGSVILVL